MKKLFLLFTIIFVTSVLIALAEETQDDGLVPNTARIRFKSAYNDDFTINQILSMFGARIEMPALHKLNSLTHNMKLKANFVQAANSNINEILSAEEQMLRTYRVILENNQDILKFCKNISSHFAIDIAEPVYKYYTQSVNDFNDVLRQNQNVLDKIKAYPAWEIEGGNPNVVIGIIDTGVLQTHEDLAGNIDTNLLEKFDLKDNDGNGYIDDINGYNFMPNDQGTNYSNTINGSNFHGTHVAGIASATANNGKGIIGIGNKCKFFPIKAGPNDASGDILYGYEGITYCAVRGFKVANCSWGRTRQKHYSELEQSVINHAVAMGVAIVNSGGNVDYNSFQKVHTFYPSIYKGVLAVGQVNQDDMLDDDTSLGAHVRIMAQGLSNWTTGSNNSQYLSVNGGTSYSAPVVAGAVAIVRSRYPELSPIQALEFTRQCTDNIENLNSNNMDLIPGRINLLKCVTTNPYSILGLTIESIEYFDKDGNKAELFHENETYKVKITLKNVLGGYNGLVDFYLRNAFDNKLSVVSVVKESQTISGILQNEIIVLDAFSIKINTATTNQMVFRLDIFGDNGYRDFIKFNFTPGENLVKFENDALMFSAYHNGVIGFDTQENNSNAVGFSLKGKFNGLYRGGLIAAANNNQAFSANYGNFSYNRNDFNILKPFAPPYRSIGVVDDFRANQPLGIQITQNIRISETNKAFTQMQLNVKNTSFNPITDLAVGYLLDWDAGRKFDGYSNNKAEYLDLNLLDSLKNKSYAAEILYNEDENIYMGAATISSEPTAFGQAAGYSNPAGYTASAASLTSGKSIQNSIISDQMMIVGSMFAGNIEPNDERNCIVCIAISESRQEIENLLTECLSSITSIESGDNPNITFYPNPAIDGIFYYNSNSEMQIKSIKDIFGRNINFSLNGNQISITNSANSIYFVEYQDIYNNRGIKKIIVNKY